jgi:hypothetical protein
MTLTEFEKQVYSVAIASPFCHVPVVVRLTPAAIKLRIEVVTGGFIDVFYNEQTSTTAYAFVRQERRIFGVDNTGGRHVHPFVDPLLHEPLPGSMSFEDFVKAIELEEFRAQSR